jgi:trimeric autotransporter adhesin
MKNIAILLVFVLGLFCGAAPAVLAQSADTHAAGTVLDAAPANAEREFVPRLVQFSGTLKDAAARPFAGVASVAFAIYAEQDGGTPLWSETQNVLTDGGGHFSVLLGAASVAGVPAELFGTGQSRWLGVTVARQPEMARVLLASVPYALKAGDAQTLGGLPASAYVTTQSLTSRASTTILAPGSTTILATPEASAQSGAAAPAAIPQATPTGSGTTNFIPLWTSSSALGNSLLFQTGGNIGINTKTPAETLDVNGNSIFRGSFQLPPGHDATTSSGFESHSFQFQASSYNSSTKASTTQSFGFRAEPLNNNTTNPSAQLDLFFVPNGGSDFINTGVSWSSTGIMTFAPGQTFSGDTVSTSKLALPDSTTGNTGLVTLGGIPFLSTTGSFDNLFLGYESGFSAVPSGNPKGNTAIGTLTLVSLTSGLFNTAVGEGALQKNTSGANNTGIGDDALFSNVAGGVNIGVGSSALSGNTTGNSNVAVGGSTLIDNVTGNQNTAIGDSAGQQNTGTGNTYLGASTNAAANVAGSTAIGFGAFAGQSDVLILGGNGVSVGIGTSTPRSQLEIAGPSGGSFLAPAPAITVTGTTGGVSAIDFNTSGVGNAGTYNPSLRMAVLEEANFASTLAFYANIPGAANNGLQQIFAVDAMGNARVTGSLTKGGGSFKIDDPIDPGGKYLSHSFVESPDMMNIYNGIVRLDAHGAAVVEMPEWFEALNRDFRYQLTAIGTPGPKLYVAAEIADNHFKIAGGKKGQRVSWQVTGIRQDAWANAHRIPTEEIKPPNEQGHYLHPDLFGAGPDKAVGAPQIHAATESKPAAAAPGAQ